MPELLFRTLPGVVLVALALASLGLSVASYVRLRAHHPAAWREEVRHSASLFWIHPVDQMRLFGFWLTGEFRALGDPVLSRLGVSLWVVWLLILPTMAWCGFTWAKVKP